MSGGNISDGPSDTSGSDTDKTVSDIAEAREKKAPSVGGYGDAEGGNPLLAKIDRMDKYHEREKRRWQDQNNLLSDKLRELRKEGKVKIDNLREMYEKQTEELVLARQKADKYILRCTDLEDEVDELKKNVSA